MRNSHSDVKYNSTIACMHPIECWIVFQVMHAWASFFLALEKLSIWARAYICTLLIVIIHVSILVLHV